MSLLRRWRTDGFPTKLPVIYTLRSPWRERRGPPGDRSGPTGTLGRTAVKAKKRQVHSTWDRHQPVWRAKYLSYSRNERNGCSSLTHATDIGYVMVEELRDGRVGIAVNRIGSGRRQSRPTGRHQTGPALRRDRTGAENDAEPSRADAIRADPRGRSATPRLGLR